MGRSPRRTTAKTVVKITTERCEKILAQICEIDLQVAALQYAVRGTWERTSYNDSGNGVGAASNVIHTALYAKQARLWQEFFMYSTLSSTEVMGKARKIAIRAYLAQEENRRHDLGRIAENIDIPFSVSSIMWSSVRGQVSIEDTLREIRAESLESEVLKIPPGSVSNVSLEGVEDSDVEGVIDDLEE